MTDASTLGKSGLTKKGTALVDSFVCIAFINLYFGSSVMKSAMNKCFKQLGSISYGEVYLEFPSTHITMDHLWCLLYVVSFTLLSVNIWRFLWATDHSFDIVLSCQIAKGRPISS